MAMLEVKNLSISFGGLKAVDDFHITIEKGQLYGLIGPNGAGKTTVFNLLTGVYKPDSGSIELDGRNITGKKTIDINQAGVTQYNLQAEAGKLSVAKSYYHYENGKLNQKSTYTYPADFWQYTDEGYLLFRGSYFMQEGRI